MPNIVTNDVSTDRTIIDLFNGWVVGVIVDGDRTDIIVKGSSTEYSDDHRLCLVGVLWDNDIDGPTDIEYFVPWDDIEELEVY